MSSTTVVDLVLITRSVPPDQKKGLKERSHENSARALLIFMGISVTFLKELNSVK